MNETEPTAEYWSGQPRTTVARTTGGGARTVLDTTASWWEPRRG